jgi:TRAP-type C4-dicarboxylate transport system permease small subunit
MKYLWWGIQILVTAVSIFFLVFGIDLLRGAYGLKDPFSFIMTFFAASFIILFSLAMAAVSLIKMVRVFRTLKQHKLNN